jgi:hypothetical protein
MQIKAIEIRDRQTFIPAIAIKLAAGNPAERYSPARCGYTTPGVPLASPAITPAHIMLLRMDGNGPATNDPYSWGHDARTMPQVHAWLELNFDKVESGDVVDVEFILGEATSPKPSERPPVD